MMAFSSFNYTSHTAIFQFGGFFSYCSIVPKKQDKPTRGPWTATPALIKEEEKGQNQQTFIHEIFSKAPAFFWEKAQTVPSVV